MVRYFPTKTLFALTLAACVVNPTFAPSAFAQSQANTGSIAGTVADEKGGAIPSASVTLVNTGTNFTRDVITDSAGRFRGLQLPLGT